jgi:hypothetical protein
MVSACPLTKETKRKLEIEIDLYEKLGHRALTVFDKTVKCEIQILRDALLTVNTTTVTARHTQMWLNFVAQRVDSPDFALSKYQMWEAEDQLSEEFVTSTIGLFATEEWAENEKKCRIICVQQQFGLVTAYAKFFGGHPTIRITRSTVADAVAALSTEISSQLRLSFVVEKQRTAARKAAFTRVAEFESARRAVDDIKSAVDKVTNAAAAVTVKRENSNK